MTYNLLIFLIGLLIGVLIGRIPRDPWSSSKPPKKEPEKEEKRFLEGNIIPFPTQKKTTQTLSKKASFEEELKGAQSKDVLNLYLREDDTEGIYGTCREIAETEWHANLTYALQENGWLVVSEKSPDVLPRGAFFEITHEGEVILHFSRVGEAAVYSSGDEFLEEVYEDGNIPGA